MGGPGGGFPTDSASVAQSSNQPEQPSSPSVLSITSGNSSKSADSSTSGSSDDRVKCRTRLLEKIKQLEAKVENCTKNWEEMKQRVQQWEKKYGEEVKKLEEGVHELHAFVLCKPIRVVHVHAIAVIYLVYSSGDLYQRTSENGDLTHTRPGGS